MGLHNLNIMKTPELQCPDVKRELDSLEQAASAIRGLASVLISDRIKQDEGEEGAMDSATYGGVIYALETVSDQVTNLCNRIDKAAEREVREAAAKAEKPVAGSRSQL